MKQHLHQVGEVTWLMMEVPEGSNGFQIEEKWGMLIFYEGNPSFQSMRDRELPPCQWQLIGLADSIGEEVWKEIVPLHYVCPACGGDGKETCNNPDHGFIEAMPGEIGRLGCPVCGHDPNHKVNRGRNTCPECGGHGMVIPEFFEEFGRETGYDNEPVEVSYTNSGHSLLKSHGMQPSNCVILKQVK